jgi:hypothetical protein
MNIEELRKKSIEQFAMLRKKAMNEAYLNTPIRSAAGASSSGGSVQAEPEPIEYNFDVIATDWTNWGVTDEASFVTFLESGGGNSKSTNSFTGISVTDFTFIDGRIRCNLTATTSGTFYLNELGITNVLGLGNTVYYVLDLSSNSLSTFNVQLPDECTTLLLNSNQIEVFNPTFTFPNITNLFLNDNQLTLFNPSFIPSGLLSLNLSNNQLTFFNPINWNASSFVSLNNNNMTFSGYVASEPWANNLEVIPALSREIQFSSNIDSVNGTNLANILNSKGYGLSI